MKKIMLAAMAAVAAMVATADDYSFTYQAELKDDKGASLDVRNQTVEIRLWKTATGTSTGDLLWGRTYNIYTDENGFFNQEVSDSLGSRTDDDPGLKLDTVFCNNGAGTVYLGLKVKDSAGEITPRQRLFAVPYAGRATSANNLIGDSHSVDGTLNLAGTNATLSSSGLVLQASSISTIGDLTAENLTAKGALSADNITFTGKVTDAAGSEVIPVPVGGVIMWTKTELPDDEHWAICDGSTKNGIKTPDLRGRFIVGVDDSDYGLNATGGEKTHQLTTEEMPKHEHKLKNAEGGKSLKGGNDGWYNDYMRQDSYDDAWHTDYPTLTAGGDKAHENRPPYYALYYIMRVK